MVKKVPCETYSRIVGYFRPVQNWNEGKKQEFKDRKVFVPANEQVPTKAQQVSTSESFESPISSPTLH